MVVLLLPRQPPLQVVVCIFPCWFPSLLWYKRQLVSPTPIPWAAEWLCSGHLHTKVPHQKHSLSRVLLLLSSCFVGTHTRRISPLLFSSPQSRLATGFTGCPHLTHKHAQVFFPSRALLFLLTHRTAHRVFVLSFPWAPHSSPHIVPDDAPVVLLAFAHTAHIILPQRLTSLSPSLLDRLAIPIAFAPTQQGKYRGSRRTLAGWILLPPACTLSKSSLPHQRSSLATHPIPVLGIN